MLEDILQSDQVSHRMVTVTDKPTGHCLALVQADQRTLVANLGAAAHYKLTHLWQGDNRTILGQSTVIYVEGFFLSHSPDVVLDIAKLCQTEAREHKTSCFI